MSDIAPAAPAPASAPPPPSEVAVDTNPVNPPQPVSGQAPDKAAEQRQPMSRRESIQRAFEKADTAERRDATKPRQAKMGDNQPPEAMEREKPKQPPLDLKKRPVDQEQPQPEPRQRGDHGHFAPRQDATPASVTKPDATARQMREVQPLPVQAPYREPPSRMSDAAKVEWHETPESVRGAVHQMHQDFGRAYQQYRGDHEQMNSIRMFDNLARKQGTTLQKALTNYVNMETRLRNDVVGGLDTIVNNLNLRTPEGHSIGLRDIAWYVVNQTPEQQQLLHSQNAQIAQTHQLRHAQARIAQLEQHAQQMQYAGRFTQTRAALDQYATTHPRLDELGEVIEQEVKLGFPLDVAYRRAELLRPSTQAPQTRTQAAQTRTHTAQTRTPDRSISGAPGPTNGTRPREKVGRRDAITNAIKRVNGSAL